MVQFLIFGARCGCLPAIMKNLEWSIKRGEVFADEADPEAVAKMKRVGELADKEDFKAAFELMGKLTFEADSGNLDQPCPFKGSVMFDVDPADPRLAFRVSSGSDGNEGGLCITLGVPFELELKEDAEDMPEAEIDAWLSDHGGPSLGFVTADGWDGFHTSDGEDTRCAGAEA